MAEKERNELENLEQETAYRLVFNYVYNRLTIAMSGTDLEIEEMFEIKISK